MHNREAIRRAEFTAGQLGGLGLLNPEQAERFITFMTDNAVVLPLVTERRMKEQTVQLDYFNLTGRRLRKGTEAVAPTSLGQIGEFTRRELVAVEAVLPADITFQFIEDNLEKEDGEDLIVREIARVVGNDVEDLGLHGDTGLAANITDANADNLDDTSGLSQNDHSFLRINDGWFKFSRGSASTHKVNVSNNARTAAGVAYWKDTVFPAVLKAMPEKWKRKLDGLVFLVAPSVEEEYRLSLQSRNTGLGDKAITGSERQNFMGVPIQPVPYITDQRDVILTNPKNLVYGVYRSIRVGRFVNERERQVEYTISLRTDYQIVADDMVCVSSRQA